MTTTLQRHADDIVDLLTRAAGVLDAHGNLHSPTDGKFVSKGGGSGTSSVVAKVKKTAREILEDHDALDVDESVAAIFNGEYAGLTVVTQRTDVRDASMFAEADVFDANGIKVGSVQRFVGKDSDGELYAEHRYLSLDRKVRGQGFATEFNAALEEWYRESGVTRIEINADIDVGGYAWARAGYDFRDGTVSNDVLERLRRAAYGPEDQDPTPDPYRLQEGFDEETGEAVYIVVGPDGDEAEYDSYYDAVDHVETANQDAAEDLTFLGPSDPEIEEVLERVEAGISVSPYEISQIGWTPGATDWPGRRVMLGSDWYGVKWL